MHVAKAVVDEDLARAERLSEQSSSTSVKRPVLTMTGERGLANFEFDRNDVEGSRRSGVF